MFALLGTEDALRHNAGERCSVPAGLRGMSPRRAGSYFGLALSLGWHLGRPALSGRQASRGPIMTDTPAAKPSDTPPDRLSTNPDSPHYDEAVLARDVGVRFKGVEKTNVDEYCVSEGWVRVTAGNAKDRHGNPLTIKLTGKVEPYFRT
jgi:hypothetical protein